MAIERWTQEQLQKVLELYVVTPFGKIHSKNPDIVSLAGQIGRTSSAVALKMVNFASLDPTLDQVGMKNVSKLDRIAWENFFNNLDRVSEEISDDIGGFSEKKQSDYVYKSDYDGTDLIGTAKIRRGQSFFRKMMLASYDQKCAITGISHSSLLVASHIDPWASNASKRLDPTNGILLCTLFDSAFEYGVIIIGDNYEVLLSNKLSESDSSKLRAIGASKIRMPSRFLPDPILLRDHRRKFSGNYTVL